MDLEKLEDIVKGNRSSLDDINALVLKSEEEALAAAKRGEDTNINREDELGLARVLFVYGYPDDPVDDRITKKTLDAAIAYTNALNKKMELECSRFAEYGDKTFWEKELKEARKEVTDQLRDGSSKDIEWKKKGRDGFWQRRSFDGKLRNWYGERKRFYRTELDRRKREWKATQPKEASGKYESLADEVAEGARRGVREGIMDVKQALQPPIEVKARVLPSPGERQLPYPPYSRKQRSAITKCLACMNDETLKPGEDYLSPSSLSSKFMMVSRDAERARPFVNRINNNPVVLAELNRVAMDQKNYNLIHGLEAGK